MTELSNISLDLLFRIDFGALVSREEEDLGEAEEEDLLEDPELAYFMDDKDQEEIDAQIFKLKEQYDFPRLHQRVYSYVRLADTGENHKGYLAYCMNLIEAEKFGCNALERAIGLFAGGELRAFLSADTGICYDTRGHLDAIAEIFRNEETDIFGPHTFFAENEGNKIRLHYAPYSNQIDVDSAGNVEYLLNALEFKREFENLTERAAQGLSEIKAGLRALKPGGVDLGMLEEVFGL